MQSNNPVLSRYEKTDKSGFAYDEGVSAYTQAAAGGAGAADVDAAFQQVTAAGGARLTINDVIVKTFAVFAITVVFAVVGWNTYDTMPWLLMVGLLGGLALGLVNAFKKVPSPPLILLYGVFQGVMLGGVSRWYSDYAAGNGWNDIVLQAVVATMTTFGVMLALYITGIVKVNKKFVSILIVAAVSYMVLGIGSFIWALFGGGERLGHLRHRLRSHRGRAGRADRRLLPDAGLRGDQPGDQARGPGARVVADGVRPARHADLALPGVPAPVRDPQPQLARGRAARRRCFDTDTGTGAFAPVPVSHS